MIAAPYHILPRGHVLHRTHVQLGPLHRIPPHPIRLQRLIILHRTLRNSIANITLKPPPVIHPRYKRVNVRPALPTPHNPRILQVNHRHLLGTLRHGLDDQSQGEAQPPAQGFGVGDGVVRNAHEFLGAVADVVGGGGRELGGVEWSGEGGGVGGLVVGLAHGGGSCGAESEGLHLFG